MINSYKQLLYNIRLLMEKLQQPAGQANENIAITPELVTDLMELMGHTSSEVLHGTISAILQYTPQSSDKLMFVNTNLIALLRKHIFTPALTTICLSTLIHFATQSQFISEYFPLIEPLVLKMREWKSLELELSLLLLLNISKEETIIAKLINEEQKRGYLIQVLYGLLQNQQKLRWILVNIFTNITSIERGRKYMVEDKICSRFIGYFHTFDEKLREASLKIVRNCSFEWEDQQFSTDILSKQHQLIDRLAKLMAFLIHKQALVGDSSQSQSLIIRYFILPGEYQQWQKQFKTSDKVKAIKEVELAIDIILILSNFDFREHKVEANITDFKQMLTLLKFTTINEETKDKLEALEIFGF